MTTGRNPRIWLIALIAALSSCFVLFASAKAKEKDKDKDSAEVKFTARAELVLIPTLVTDKSGNHISGLTKEDFKVFENGAEQKVATFEEITSDAHRVSRPADPNVFSNSIAAG